MVHGRTETDQSQRRAPRPIGRRRCQHSELDHLRTQSLLCLLCQGSVGDWLLGVDHLFPGRRAGQPLAHRSLDEALSRHGIPVQAGRTSALRQLVLQAPAPVVARMLDFHDKHAIRVLTEAGGSWNRYVPDNHDR